MSWPHFAFFFSANGQSNTQVKALEIGDQVPDLTLTNLYNYHDAKKRPATTAKLSDLEGKLIILDFWATWCSSCIEAMPHVEQMAKAFQGDLFVIGVSYEPYKTVEQFFKRQSANGQARNLPTVYGDSYLSRLFPHLYVPHYVWINDKGIVVAFTSAEEINEENIKNALHHVTNQMAVKKDMDTHQPLFLNQDFPIDSLLRYSVLIKYFHSGAGSTTRERKKNGQVVGQVYTGYSLLNIYQFIAGKVFKKAGRSFSKKLMLLETKDSLKFIKDAQLVRTAPKEQRPAYLYDFIVPPAKRDSLYELMLADLNRYSGYDGRMAKRQMPCLALQRSKALIDLSTKGGESVTLVLNGSPAVQQNQPVSNLVARLNESAVSGLPIVDETGISGKVDLKFSGSTDLQTVNKELQQQGLILVKTFRELPVFVLGDPLPNIKALQHVQ